MLFTYMQKTKEQMESHVGEREGALETGCGQCDPETKRKLIFPKEEQ
jgi:hypothetical protein